MRPLAVLGLVLLGVGLVVGGVVATGGAGAPPTDKAGASVKPGDGAETPSTGALPEGNSGIARKYPGDAKIAGDPAVIFADDFEGYAKAEDLGKRYDSVYQKQYVGIMSAAADCSASGTPSSPMNAERSARTQRSATSR